MAAFCNTCSESCWIRMRPDRQVHRPRMRRPLARALLFLSVMVACSSALAATDAVETTPAQVIARYPHDARAFTQGLLYYAGALYESTGLYGQSTLRRVAIADGAVLAQSRL